ncbi:MAG: efflux RND transporter periplasmic adaptor subunit [Planctomycetota bacterium]
MKTLAKTFGPVGRWFHKHLVAIIIIALAVLASTLIALMLPKRDQVADAAAAAPIPVETELIRPLERIEDSFQLKGVAQPWREVNVRAELSEQVVQLGRNEQADRPLRKGDPVEKGQLLVQLRTDRLQAAVDRAEAQLGFDRTQLQSIRELAAENAATPKDVEDASRRVEISQADLRTARANLQRATIEAPIDGTLNWLIEPGEQVQPNVLVAEIVDNSATKIELYIPEQDIAYFEEGQVHQVVDWPGKEPEDKPIDAQITFLAEKAEPGVHSTEVELMLDDTRGRRVRNGHIVTVRLARQVKTDVIMIPLTAVVPGEGDLHYVHVAEAGKAVRKPLQINLRMIQDVNRSGKFDGQDRVQVVRGLVALERLVTEGTRGLSDGQPIREPAVKVAEVPFAHYQVQASGRREVSPAELAELAERFGDVEGVLAADVVEPDDVELEITIDPKKLELLGLTSRQLLERIESPLVSDPDDKVQRPLPLRLHVLTKTGTEADRLLQKVLAWREDGRPIYLAQVIDSLGPIPPDVPFRAAQITVSLDGADMDYIGQQILPPLRRAIESVDGGTVEDLSKPGLARLRIVYDQSADLDEIMLALSAAVARQADALPGVAPMPEVRRAKPTPPNQVVLRVAPDSDTSQLLEKLQETTKQFLAANNGEKHPAGKLNVQRVQNAVQLAAEGR